MSLGRCIPEMVKRGEIDAPRAKRMKELFDELEAYYAQSMGPDAAAAEASEATLKQLASEARLKKRQTLLQINRQREALRDLDRYSGGASFAAVRGLLDRDTNAPYANVVKRTEQIVFQAHADLRDFIQRHRRDFFGQPKDPETLRNVVREMHGQSTGDGSAKAAAGAIGDVAEKLRQRFNAAGGNIGKLDHWYPHSWSPLLVRKVSQDDFVAAMMPELDRARILDARTGAPMADKALRTMLEGIYETIRTDGLTGDPSAALRGPGKLANQRAEHRVLHFKDADAWLRVNDRFGAERNPFNAIIGHIDGMARDIAMMERLGPNPDATMRYLLDAVAKKRAGEAEPRALLKIGGGRTYTEKMYRFLKGEGRQLVEPDSLLYGPPMWVTRAVEGGKNLTTATKLGSATISAGTDLVTQRRAARLNGLPQTAILEQYLRQLNPASAADRELAAELELGMRDAAQSLSSLMRWGIETDRAGWTAVLADTSIRMSGLNKVTEAGQRAYGMVALRTLARHRAIPWDEVPALLRESLERYGIGATDWPTIRNAPTIDRGGRSYVSARAIRERGTVGSDAVAAKVMDWVLGETASAVQESSLTTRVALAAGDRGSWSNLIFGTGMQFKAFGIGLMIEQGRRAMALGPTKGGLYGIDLFIGATLFGAAIIGLKEVSKGKDPPPMDNATFWGRASLQGGALSIMGDVLGWMAGTYEGDRVGGYGDFLAGPLGSTVVDVQRAAQMALPGKERQDGSQREANPAGGAIYLARRNTPFLSSGWYTRAAWDRLVMDRLAEEYDPSFADRQAREAKRDATNRQGHWLTKDGVKRAPEWENAWAAEEM